MSDFKSVEYALGSIIKAPGFVQKRGAINLLASAYSMGLARTCSNKNLTFRLRKGQTLYFEIFLGGRLFQVRAEISQEMAPGDTDPGYIMPNSFWYVFGSHSCRSLEIEISPHPSMRVWMIPTFDHNGFGWFDVEGSLCEDYGFPSGRFMFQSNILVDTLWQILESIDGDDDIIFYDRPVSQLRMRFVSEILNPKRKRKEELPVVPLPSLIWQDQVKSWDDKRLLIYKAWSQAQILVDPMLAVRRNLGR